MDTHKDFVVTQVQTYIISILKEIAKFNSESDNEDRGIYFFGPNPSEGEKQLGNSFLRLTLECLLVWSLWHPFDNDKGPSKFQVT
jgi:hypothetical protein